jgi:hypothetical protein
VTCKELAAKLAKTNSPLNWQTHSNPRANASHIAQRANKLSVSVASTSAHAFFRREQHFRQVLASKSAHDDEAESFHRDL